MFNISSDNDNNSFNDFLNQHGMKSVDNTYSIQFNNYYNGNKNEYYNNINRIIEEYIMNNIKHINIKNTEINEIVNTLWNLTSKKSQDVYKDTNLTEIINIDTYKNIKQKNRLYYIKLYSLILINIFGQNNDFVTFITKNIKHINIQAIANLIIILTRLETYVAKQNNDLHKNQINAIVTTIQNYFDSEKNIIKLINFVQENFIGTNELDNTYNMTQNKRNIKHVINIIKQNGYLFFDEYQKYLINKYNRISNINKEMLTKDQKLVNYLIIIMKDNKNVLEITCKKLLNSRLYLQDIEDSYYNTLNYRKININIDSDKYKKINVENLERNIVNLNVVRQIYSERTNEFELPSDISIYVNILKAYYLARYLDRKLEINNYNSSVIVAIEFDEKSYNIEMNFYQYAILKLIYKNVGIKQEKILNKLGIDENIIINILNSLLDIELITNTNKQKKLRNMEFKINNKFTYKQNSFNICKLSST